MNSKTYLTGADYQTILKATEKEADIIIWNRKTTINSPSAVYVLLSFIEALLLDRYPSMPNV